MTDAAGGFATKILAITIISGPSIISASLPNGEATAPYSQTLAASSDTSPYTWSITSGTLPAWLALDASTGTISGTPSTAAGAASITFKVTDSAGGTASKVLSVTIVAGPSITTDSLADGDVTVPYSHPLAVTGGISPYIWSITAGILPSGLNFYPATGGIIGTPTVSGPAAVVTFRVTDNAGGTASKTLSITINNLPVITTSSLLPNGKIGVPYSQTLTLTGGSSPFFWAVKTGYGNLPAGLSLNASTGAITGIPTARTSSTFTIQVQDNAIGVDLKVFTLNIISTPPLTDFDGDGKTDISVFRPSAGAWYIDQSSNGAFLAIGWGVFTDVPAPGDYDGDGKTDVAIYRPSDGGWYIRQSSNGQMLAIGWGGVAGDVPV